MKLASILNPKLIFCPIEGKNREEIYSNMLQKAENTIELPAPATVLVREMMAAEDSSAISYGPISLPHVRRADFQDLYIMLGVPAKPIKLTDAAEEPCRIVVMSLINHETSDVYLKAISAFTRYIQQPGNLDRLTTAQNGTGLLEKLLEDNVTLKKNLTAEDVMNKVTLTLSPDENLAVALDIFNRERRTVLPVLENGKLVGELDATEVIRKFIPEYVFMMESTKFLISFEPFEKIFREEQTHTVRDLMQKPKMVIDSEMPLIRLTIALVNRTAETLFVVDGDGKMLGEISIKNIIHKVLRG